MGTLGTSKQVFIWRFAPGWNLTQDPDALSGARKRSPPSDLPSTPGKPHFSHLPRDFDPTASSSSGGVDPSTFIGGLADLVHACEILDPKQLPLEFEEFCKSFEILPAGTGPILPVRDTPAVPGLEIQPLL
jgi:hypothetical protein